MMKLQNNLLLAAGLLSLLLLPRFYARQFPMNINEIGYPYDTNLIRFLQQRYYRQNDQPSNHTPQIQTSSFWNLLNTHGIGISATLGGGIRLASANNHDTNDKSNTPRPSTNNIWDRYLSSTLHFGVNTHLGNNKQGQEGAAQQAHGGSLPIVGQGELDTTDTTTQVATFRDRLNNYPLWNRWNALGCDAENEGGCTNSSNIFGRIFARLFLRERSTDELFWNRTPDVENSEDEGIPDNVEINTKDEHINNNTNTKQGVNWVQDFQTFVNTIRHFLVDRITSYITQDIGNEQFLQTMVRKSVLRIINDTQPEITNSNTNGTDTPLLQALWEYYSNDRIRFLFPQIELIRTDMASRNISTEDEYNTLFNDNLK